MRGSKTICTLLAISAVLPLNAQSSMTTPDSASAQPGRKLFNKQDLILAGAMAATTFALFPLDTRFATQLQDSSTQANRFFQHASTGVEYIASPGAYFIGGSLYFVGRIAGLERVADLGWHGTEAVLVGEGISYLLKGTLGRGRPLLTDGQVPRNFEPGRGFKDSRWRSFPSGHTTTAFAAASAVTDEANRWWPGSAWIVGPLMYGGASMVGLSRMFHNRHWASDVALGALIGTFSGKKAVLASHQNPGNRLDRIMLGLHARPNSFGMMDVGWRRTW